MNILLLSPKIQEFIDKNINSDTSKLLFKGSPFNGIPIQELIHQIISKKKSKKKLPTWYATKNILYPPKLNIEQTSSEITSYYKSKLLSGNSLIDITGGFGVDCFYFSRSFKKIIHCEINHDLSIIANHNFKQLNSLNIQTINDDGLLYLKKNNEIFDCIYVDPSRRDNTKRKVFLLKDCKPNIPINLDFLFSKSNTILIKNSPILDITASIKELKFVKEIYIIAVKNEVKELLFLLENNFNGDTFINTVNIISETKKQEFNFKLDVNIEPKYGMPLNYLYEPNSAIFKSGAFNKIANTYNITKLHKHSHLYTSKNEITNFPGRIFRIINFFEYNKKNIKKYLKIEKANITTRNFPKSVEVLRKETKLKDGGATYLFFTKNINNKLTVIECEK